MCGLVKNHTKGYCYVYVYSHFPVNGNWGSWSKYFSCSVTCGEGTQTRKRLCDEPAPKHGGKDCEGPEEESQSCSTSTTCQGITLSIQGFYLRLEIPF